MVKISRFCSKRTGFISSALVGLLLISSGCYSDSYVSIEERYEQLSAKYNRLYVNNELEAAFLVAMQQLEMDESDSIAFLRLALAATGSCDKIKPYFSQYGSLNSLNDVTWLARALIEKECGIRLIR